MKNFDGMLRLPYTSDELGKNFPPAPSPSLFIDRGAIPGLRMTKCLLQESREYLAPTVTTAATAIIPRAETHTPGCDSLRRLIHHPAKSATPSAQIAACVNSSLV